ncbi:peptidase M56 [Flavobacterium rhamnosiphilum]|uniref:Peptidase M56 n=1 Tax=Flavobacterium rhamnosiphilum TaxID=2541724 RepID=A0A4R5F8N4_9FLAO|nr:M56 family metallopeptidase [Flavobacterium rhamnosiphilum]TDE44474.1 peptidase M56 [Flavobacterium rhamnosiphilum]
MEALYIYLIKSSGLIALFYLAYYFMLRKETFFTSNRWFLLLGLFTSVVLPLVVYTKIIVVASSSKNIDWSRIPVTTSITNEAFEINWYLIFGIAYGIGIVLFLIKFAFDFYSLNTVLKGKTIQNQADFKFIDTTENVAPFSYFNIIVYNSSLYSSSELENILEHEKVHSEQNHTVDVLISRLFCILFWFNPLIWLYKKAILQNLEFIADNEATKKISDKKAYQFTLLKITTHENCVAITNHFYQSLIKKRIVMLNKNQSNKRNSWKYALVVPVLVAFMLYFQVKVVAQEKAGTISDSPKNYDMLGIIIENDFKDDAFEYFSKKIKKEKNIDVKFYAIKRDENNKIIAISISCNNNIDQKTTHEIKGDLPIKAFELSFKKNKLGQNSVSFKDVNIDEINNAPRGYAAPISDTEEGIIKNEDFVSDIKAPKPPTTPTPPNHSKIPVPAVKMPVLPKTTAATNLTYKKGGKTIHKQITIVNDKKEVKTEIVSDSDPQTVELNTEDDATQVKRDIEQAKLDRIQAKKDIEQAKRDRIQAIEDRKQVIEDRKQAIEDRKQALRDRKQALKDTQTAIMKAN